MKVEVQAVKGRIAKDFGRDSWRWQGWAFVRYHSYTINGQTVFIEFKFDLKTLNVKISELASKKVTAEKAFTSEDDINECFRWAAEQAIATANAINERVAPYSDGYNNYNKALLD